MTGTAVRRAFISFHVTLGVVILVESVRTLIHALHEFSGSHLHLGIVAGVESLAALLLLWPKTLRIGGVALVAIFAVAIVAHAVQGDFPGHLLVYAAGVLFVTVHGSAWSPGAAHPPGAAGGP